MTCLSCGMEGKFVTFCSVPYTSPAIPSYLALKHPDRDETDVYATGSAVSDPVLPLTAPLEGVTDASHLPLASLAVQERRESFFLPCLTVTFLQEPFFVAFPLVAVSV